MSKGDDYVSINVDIKRMTIGAVHVRCADNVPRWIPRSLIFGPDETTLMESIGELMAIRVMRWFVEKGKIPTARNNSKP